MYQLGILGKGWYILYQTFVQRAGIGKACGFTIKGDLEVVDPSKSGDLCLGGKVGKILKLDNERRGKMVANRCWEGEE